MLLLYFLYCYMRYFFLVAKDLKYSIQKSNLFNVCSGEILNYIKPVDLKINYEPNQDYQPKV